MTPTDEGTIRLEPCPECKDDPKPGCRLCGGSGKVQAGKK